MTLLDAIRHARRLAGKLRRPPAPPPPPAPPAERDARGQVCLRGYGDHEE